MRTEHNTEALTNHAAELARLNSITAGLVMNARNNGASWSEIGAALGTSRQAAQQKYSAIDSEVTPKQAAADRVASKKVDAPAPAKPSTKVAEDAPAKSREATLDEVQQAIYRGEITSALEPIDWKAAGSLAVETPWKCTYCGTDKHYNLKTGAWYVYRGCTITLNDLARHQIQDTYTEGAK